MRSMKLAAVLALFTAGQALGAQEVVPELLLGGDNQAATVKGGLPVAYDTTGATTVDGAVSVTAGELVDWAVNVVVSGTGGDINNGAANLVVDLELSQGGSPVAIGGVADGCTGATGSFCSTMNDGSSVDTDGGLTPQLASFAISIDSRSYVEFFGGSDPLPEPISGRIVDDVADDGANMDYSTYPSAAGYPAGSTAPTGVLVGMGAGYSSYTTPSDNSTLADGNMAGVGCVGELDASTCASPNSVGLGNGPFFEGQINTAGLNGTYTLTVNVEVAGNNVLDGSFDPFAGGAAIPSFAEASDLGGTDTITFEVVGVPGALVSAASRKSHSGTDLDIALFPAGAVTASGGVGTESRGNGLVDRLVLAFGGSQTADCSIVTSLSSGSCTGVTDLGGNEYEVALSGVANNSCLEVTVVSGETFQALNIKGDTDGTGGVNVIDLSNIKTGILDGGVVDASNASLDMDLSNSLNVIDLSEAKTGILNGNTASCP